MTILVSSNNKNKIREINNIMVSLGLEVQLLTLSDIGYTDEITEDGVTFEENAKIKARVGASLGYITMADDSGLEVDALGGAPGVYSARYAGLEHDDDRNNEKLLYELNGVEDSKRTARFVSCIACITPDGLEFTVRGTCEGVILHSCQGANGFGYDPLFYIKEYGKTFAQLSMEEKNKISHRGKAIKVFTEKFMELISEGVIDVNK